jgi:hypothetical protein
LSSKGSAAMADMVRHSAARLIGKRIIFTLR